MEKERRVGEVYRLSHEWPRTEIAGLFLGGGELELFIGVSAKSEVMKA